MSARDAAKDYLERWPAWAREAFKVEPVADAAGNHHARIRCETCAFNKTQPIDLRQDPSPVLLGTLRGHMDRHGYVPLAERKAT